MIGPEPDQPLDKSDLGAERGLDAHPAPLRDRSAAPDREWLRRPSSPPSRPRPARRLPSSRTLPPSAGVSRPVPSWRRSPWLAASHLRRSPRGRPWRSTAGWRPRPRPRTADRVRQSTRRADPIRLPRSIPDAAPARTGAGPVRLQPWRNCSWQNPEGYRGYRAATNKCAAEATLSKMRHSVVLPSVALKEPFDASADRSPRGCNLILRAERNPSDRAVLDQADPPLRRTVGEMGDVDVAAERRDAAERHRAQRHRAGREWPGRTEAAGASARRLRRSCARSSARRGPGPRCIGAASLRFRPAAPSAAKPRARSRHLRERLRPYGSACAVPAARFPDISRKRP